MVPSKDLQTLGHREFQAPLADAFLGLGCQLVVPREAPREAGIVSESVSVCCIMLYILYVYCMILHTPYIYIYT